MSCGETCVLIVFLGPILPRPVEELKPGVARFLHPEATTSACVTLPPVRRGSYIWKYFPSLD